MSDIAIRVENLSKLYRIGVPQERYKTLRDSLMNAVTAPFRRFSSVFSGPSSVLSSRSSVPGPQSSIFGPRSSVVNSSVLSHRSSVLGPRSSVVCNDTIWALKDVSFGIKRGEVVGIIGRNGAGKTTLLKILSRITEPTEGQAEICGRVSSLLEVGTGFHPELTGRENIYLNGAILGMKKAEIERKFDEIVAFSEIEKFIDMPVKHYSSGMYVRLAFAVAAHMEPEILLVDEVLAVGDYEFQKKCLGKMGDVAKGGRTVLFVSHNMPSILNLCHRAILLQAGSIQMDGPAQMVVDTYIGFGAKKGAEVKWDMDHAPGNEVAKIKAVRILDHEEEVSSDHRLSNPITLEMDFWCLRSGIRLNPVFHLYTAHGVGVFNTTNLHEKNWGTKHYERGLYRSRCIIPGQLLNAGQYRVSAIIVRDVNIVEAREEEIITFQAHDDGTGRGDYSGGWMGVIRPVLNWQVEPIEGAII